MGLVYHPHNTIILNLLFALATWHSLAKLELHTDTSLQLLHEATETLGKRFHMFQSETCEFYDTRISVPDTGARGRKTSRLSNQKPTSTRSTTKAAAGITKKCLFDMNMYKFHVIGTLCVEYSQSRHN